MLKASSERTESSDFATETDVDEEMKFVTGHV